MKKSSKPGPRTRLSSPRLPAASGSPVACAMQQILNPQVITQVVLGSTYPPAVTGPDWQRLTGWAIGT